MLNVRAFILLTAALTSVVAGCGDDDTPSPGDGDSGPGVDGGTGGTGGRMDSGTPLPDAGGTVSVGVTCEEADVADADMVLSADLRANTTLRGLIHVTTAIDVAGQGTQITIEPGTTFIMDADTDIEFGWNSSTVTVIAVGTEELPIRFCAKVDQPGYYGGVYTGREVTSDSAFEHVIISNGGGGEVALSMEGSLRVAHVQVEDSGADGVRAARFANTSTDLSVRRAAGAAVVLTAPEAVTSFPLGGDFEDNEDNSVHVAFTDIRVDTTFKALPIPYVQERAIDVHDATLVFEAGVDYRFAADTDLEIGWNSNMAELLVEGVEDNPVTFQGVMPNKGYYYGILVRGNVRSSSKISYARILHGGGVDNFALAVDARITLDHVTLEDNARGAYITSVLQTDSANLTITGTNEAPLTVNCDPLTTLPTGGSFTGNADDEIVIDECGTTVITGTIPDLEVPFHVLESIELQDGSDVVIEAGTEFIMAADTDILVGWNSGAARLSAVGTAEERIVFAGEQATAGYWEAIQFTSSALTTSALDYVTIKDAGRAGSAALLLRRAIPVTNTTIDNSAGAGIERETADTSDYTGGGNVFTNVAQGNVIVR